MSAARIAARLRERLPEGWAVVVRDGDVYDVSAYDRDGALTGNIDSVWRRWSVNGRGPVGTIPPAPTPYSGRNWPERLADALTDALLGFGR